MSLVKRPRHAGAEPPNSTALVHAQDQRASRLNAPTIELSGHESPVLAVDFDSTGQYLASAGTGKEIFIWQTYQDNAHLLTLRGHNKAVLDLAWSRDSSQLFSGSADHTVATYDLETGTRVRKHLVASSTAAADSAMVNALATVPRGTELIVAGTDAGLVAVFDPRDKRPVYTIRPQPFAAQPRHGGATFPVLAVAANEDGSMLFSAGVDDVISAWDPRLLSSNEDSEKKSRDMPIFTLPGHTNSVTSLKVSPDGQTLLSNSMDSTVRTWNIRPFVAGAPINTHPGSNTGYYSSLQTPSPRAIRVFDGAPAGIENRLLRAAWSTFPSQNGSEKGLYVAAGSGDQTCAVWDSRSGRLLSKLPGHQGAVTDVSFSPIEPIIATASSDGNVILGELPSNIR